MNQIFSFMGALSTFVEERIIFTRERASGPYETGPFYLAKLTTELPLVFFFTMLFSVILCLWLAGSGRIIW